MASSFLLNAFLSARLRSTRLTDEADVEKSYRGKYREILEERVRREQKIKAEFYDRLLIIAFLSANVGLVCYSPPLCPLTFLMPLRVKLVKDVGEDHYRQDPMAIRD
jgi:hypothetical protein